jgi:quercetin dioxygenase-like cupin family protein
MTTYRFGHQLAHVKVTGEESGGAVGVVIVESPGGPAAPLHVHQREDETFHVLEGEITLLVGDEVVRAVAGDVVFAPRGVPHTYAIDSETARIFVASTPSGFEEFVAAVGVPGDGDPTPFDPEMLAMVAAEFGIDILGPPMTRADIEASATAAAA